MKPGLREALEYRSFLVKVQTKAFHVSTGRGSSSVADGALPYDVVHLAGGGHCYAAVSGKFGFRFAVAGTSVVI